MSQAPVMAEEYQGADRMYAQATAELNRLVDGGSSWSGHERNNLFLNLGRLRGDAKTPEFADCSALAGFDFPDDSRAIAALDWDFDGDLDFVVTNRSAPRVRILENRAVTRPASSVLIKLVGREDNRDAIGSRVELVLKDRDGEDVVLARTLHAGQGFISQSSKWLHFGIPEGAGIVCARVFWTRHEPQQFVGLRAGQFLILTEGVEEAAVWEAPRTTIRTGGPVAEQPEELTVAAHLERPVPLPEIPYKDLAGAPQAIRSQRQRPIVINLWATWCVPCRAELQEFAKEAEIFRGAGVDVLALCVDADLDDPARIAEVGQILADVGFPFEAGIAAEKTIELLHIVHNTVFVRPSELPVPTTLLIAPGARVASVIRGRVRPAELLPALAALSGPAEGWAAFSAAGAGRWIHGADTVFYSGIAKELLERGWDADAARFLTEQRVWLQPEGKKYAELLMLVGTRLLGDDARQRGLALLEAAVEVAPDLSAAQNNLAVTLLQSGRGGEAVAHLEAAINADPDFIDPKLNLARYHVAGQRHDEALALVGQVLARDYHPGAIRIKAQVLLARGQTDELYKVFAQIVEHEPEQPAAWVNLGKLQLQLHDAGAALRSFEAAGALVPENLEIRSAVDDLRRQLATGAQQK